MSGDQVLAVIADGDTQNCPNCNYHVVSRYRLESESDDAAVCGDCFGEWLARGNYAVVAQETGES